MVKLPDYLDDPALHLVDLMASGRRDAAIRFAQRHLREGEPRRVFLKIVADLLEPPTRSRGRPSVEPWNWYKIGREFEDRRDSGQTYEEAVAALAEEENASEATIARTLRFYWKVIKEADDAVRDSQ